MPYLYSLKGLSIIKNTIAILSTVCVLFFLNTCTKDKTLQITDPNGYPEAIGDIVITKCAVSGCHNDISKAAAGGLSLTSWNKLFEGTEDNAAVIPYRSDQSFLMFFVNTYADIGPTLTPTMPYNNSPLTKQEVITIRNWINTGAPDEDGFIKFSDNPNRKKLYVTNQGCDLVTVIDVETNLIMRYIDVGISPAIESPHMVEVSPDGKYWYVCFYAGNTFQKFDATDDKFLGEVDIGAGSWNTFAISSDSKIAFVIDWNSSGTIAVVKLDDMSLITKYQGGGLLEWPHGVALNQSNTTLYVTAQYGNFIYKIDVADVSSPSFTKISLQTGQSPTAISFYDPHEIYLSPDESKYFVTCQKSNEVRVMSASNDSLLATIPVGVFPQEMSFSKSSNFVFVTCTEDNVTFSGKIGSVSIIDYQNLVHVKSIYTGYQPHGVTVDDTKQFVYVANRNANPDGPAPHHTTECGGRNGYLTIIDMNTLEIMPGYKAELSVDPYYIAIKP